MFKKTMQFILVTVMVLSGLSVANPIELAATNSVKDQLNSKLLKNPEYLDLLKAVIEGELDHGLAGAQLAVYKGGELVIDEAFGYTNNFYNTYNEDGSVNFEGAKALPHDERNAVTSDTLFDMASNTKMYAAVFAMQKLVDEGKVKLSTLIKDIFPEFTDVGNENGWKDIISVEHVLSHYAGFAPDPQYHNNNYDVDDGIVNGINDLYSQDKATTLKMIMKTPITTQPGTSWAYSDVDMMMASFIVEKITGKDLDTYVKDEFYKPLGLDRITFNPLRHGFAANELSSAEVHGNTRDGRIDFNNVRQTVVTGEVHDEKAFYSMDGVSGHAGLFGTAKEVAYLAQVMLDGTLNGKRFFSEETIESFTEPAKLSTQTKGGWRRRNSGTGAGAWFSYFSPEGTIGHTGWTGTVTFIDPVNDVTVALFTNRTNTPIHGPGANDFWTANSNVTSYTAISEFVYQALGLGNDQSIDSTLTNMLAVEIGYKGGYVYPTQDIISGYTSAKRNVIRALISTLEDVEQNLRVIDTSRDPLFRERIKDTKEFLKESENNDLNFLLVTKVLDEKIIEFSKLDEGLYTEDSWLALSDLITQASELLLETPSQQTVNDMVDKLAVAFNDLVLKTNKEYLQNRLDEILAKEINKALYTDDSYETLVLAINNAKDVLSNESATQEEIDQSLQDLEKSFIGLIKKDEVPTPSPEPKPEPKPEPDENDKLPATGVDTKFSIFGISSVLLGIFITLLNKKRKVRV